MFKAVVHFKFPVSGRFDGRSILRMKRRLTPAEELWLPQTQTVLARFRSAYRTLLLAVKIRI